MESPSPPPLSSTVLVRALQLVRRATSLSVMTPASSNSGEVGAHSPSPSQTRSISGAGRSASCAVPLDPRPIRSVWPTPFRDPMSDSLAAEEDPPPAAVEDVQPMMTASWLWRMEANGPIDKEALALPSGGERRSRRNARGESRESFGRANHELRSKKTLEDRDHLLPARSMT